MKVSGTKTSQRVERNLYRTTWKIKSYGKNNDYPQKVLEILNSSGTGKTCFDIYTKFIDGGGFVDPKLAEEYLNPKEKANSLLRKCGKDLRAFNGCALLIKYDGTLRPESIYNIPFEHCRLQIDSEKKYTGLIAVHPDWTGINGVPFKMEDIRYLNAYNPETVREEMREAGGPQDYLGQVYYFTSDGDLEYPISPFDPVITDMLTEESCSTVKHRNAKFNFLPGGILVRKGIRPHLKSDQTVDLDDAYNREKEESRQEILKMQGDENACKLWVVDIDSDEEKPEFVPFQTRSLDKEYTYTEKSVKDNIGEMFLIPPIIRGIDVGAGFGADLMRNAYDFMNSVVGGERRELENIFRTVLEFWGTQFTDYSLLQLEYISKNKSIEPNLLPDLTHNERRGLIGFEPVDEPEAEVAMLAVTIGVGGTQSLVTIVTDPVMTSEQKVQLLIKLFAFTEEEARKIIEP